MVGRMVAIDATDDGGHVVVATTDGVHVHLVLSEPRRLIVELSPTKAGPGALCMRATYAGTKTPFAGCVPAEDSALARPPGQLEELWVRACDERQAVCGRELRAIVDRPRARRRGE